MKIAYVMLTVLAFCSLTAAQDNAAKKYPWQTANTDCNKYMTLCWYGADSVSDPTVLAYGNRWVSQDKEEKPFEWITEVRCVEQLHTCILARNQNVGAGGTITNIDLYHIQEWSDFQIRAIGENDFPAGKECEIDSLLLNRVEGSVSMLSVPGPAASEQGCSFFLKPKTVVYTLDLALPDWHQDKQK